MRSPLSQRNQYSKSRLLYSKREGTEAMNNIIYLVGLVVIVLAVLSFFGLR